MSVADTGLGALAPQPGLKMPPPRAKHSVVEVLLIAAVLLYAAFLLIGPLAAIVWGAFGAGLGAFFGQITSRDALEALKLTLILSVSATVINTVMGVCVAWVLVRDDFPGRRFVNGLVDLPFAVSPVIAGFMLILLFGRAGWFSSVVEVFGIKVVFALPGMLLATTFVSLPFVIREVMPVLAHMGVEQENAAYTMGASTWQAFWHVTLPAIRWGLFYGISLTFARALGEFGAVLVVSGGVSRLTESATLFIFRSLDDRNEAGAYAMAVLLAATSFVVLAAMEFFKKRTEEG
jgi:sulfate transport system permease protein